MTAFVCHQCLFKIMLVFQLFACLETSSWLFFFRFFWGGGAGWLSKQFEGDDDRFWYLVNGGI